MFLSHGFFCSAHQDLDLLNDQFDDFATTVPAAAPFSAFGPAVTLPPAPQQYAMSHSATTPSFAARPGAPLIAGAAPSTHSTSAVNDLDFLNNLPQSQSMSFQHAPPLQQQQPQQMRMPHQFQPVQPAMRPQVQSSPNYSSIGPVGYQFQPAGIQPAQVP